MCMRSQHSVLVTYALILLVKNYPHYNDSIAANKMKRKIRQKFVIEVHPTRLRPRAEAVLRISLVTVLEKIQVKNTLSVFFFTHFLSKVPTKFSLYF